VHNAPADVSHGHACACKGHVTLKGAHILTESMRSNGLYRTSDYCDFYKDRT